MADLRVGNDLDSYSTYKEAYYPTLGFQAHGSAWTLAADHRLAPT